MDCALDGGLRASPSAPINAKAPRGVGRGHRPSREHGRPAPRLRVRPFPATIDPAGTLASADCSAASRGLSTPAVPCHPTIGARAPDGHPRTPTEPSAGKTSNLPRAPTAFTQRPLDDIGLRLVVQARPGRIAFYAQRTDDDHAADPPCVPRVAISPPASSPPRLTTEQLPSACGWCHQPPQGTCTPELLVMPRAHRPCSFPASGSHRA